MFLSTTIEQNKVKGDDNICIIFCCVTKDRNVIPQYNVFLVLRKCSIINIIKVINSIRHEIHKRNNTQLNYI